MLLQRSVVRAPARGIGALLILHPLAQYTVLIPKSEKLQCDVEVFLKLHHVKSYVVLSQPVYVIGQYSHHSGTLQVLMNSVAPFSAEEADMRVTVQLVFDSPPHLQ